MCPHDRQRSGAGCADDLATWQHQHKFEAIAQFILSHPMFYKIKPKSIRSSIPLS